MKIFVKCITTGLVSLWGLTLVGCLESNTKPTAPSLEQRNMEKSIIFLESNLSALGGMGYVQWTPTTAAAEMVETMNATEALTPEEEADYQQAGIRPPATIPYVLNQPSDTWQIVLVPDDGQQVIHVRGYGKDLETPILEKDLPCCDY